MTDPFSPMISPSARREWAFVGSTRIRTTHAIPGARAEATACRRTSSERTEAPHAPGLSHTTRGGSVTSKVPLLVNDGRSHAGLSNARTYIAHTVAHTPQRCESLPAMPRLSRYFELVRDSDGHERLCVGVDGAALLRFALR